MSDVVRRVTSGCSWLIPLQVLVVPFPNLCLKRVVLLRVSRDIHTSPLSGCPVLWSCPIVRVCVMSPGVRFVRRIFIRSEMFYD